MSGDALRDLMAHEQLGAARAWLRSLAIHMTPGELAELGERLLSEGDPILCRAYVEEFASLLKD